MATLNPNLKDFWIDDKGRFRKARNRILFGGRASTKSWEYAGRAAQIGQEYKTRFLCVRRYQNKIKDSVYTLIKNQIGAFKFTGYNVLATEIKHINGSEFAFYGIEHNTDEIKSFEGADVLWIEEAHNLTKEQWEILEPTIRKEGSEIWISFNPDLITDFVYQNFVVNPPKNTIVRMVNYPDNPFLSKTLIDVIEQMKEQDFEQWQHVYMGVPRNDDDDAIIKRSWVEAAIDAHLELDVDLTGAKNTGYDVADSGADKNATARFDGAICLSIKEWKAQEDDLDKSAMRAYREADGGRLIYDSIGVGAGVGAILKKEGKKGYFKFNAGDKPFNPEKEYAPKIKNKDKFENLKSQAWRDVADRLRNTYNAINKDMKYDASELISISSKVDGLESLKTELCSPKKDTSKRGLDMVESKKDLAKRGIKSPNKADAFIMGACPHLVKSERKAFTIHG